ncbi:vacuolar proton-transporting V-type ATPase complex assembly [Trichomonas vaginalis G3]|uniref:vacuolar proton-transporting V-type ATPase complex assembly n=1 Tax=Trichomonas vaginalis (strain ATCC PRA-98 / G3) TaxID=412133 RepID=UPI0021E5879A|nr:vacuolar proton-transporting V-type ATPase complex assembly [Trichomonas vaginalis G3]KAI5521690.1 vacuolar proton-transporting V-type ATPase complex assembly [Trichomonas vaginalis G3]
MAERATHNANSPVPIRTNNTQAEAQQREPPTFIETNNFQYSFQLFNDAYGVPNYNEINAGAFYCMYPFLFGIMFGDMGHSIFYLLVTLGMFIMVPLMKKKGNSMGGMLEMIDRFKWFLLFASVCSFYCGFLYNETFCLPINFFGSHYHVDDRNSNPQLTVYKKNSTSIYPFGLDPAWFFKDNELIFSNSLKMKMSVIVGMAQMIFGLILSFINNFVQRDWVSLITLRVPELLYLVPFYGYMVVIIIWKWCTNFKGNPSLYNVNVQKDGINLIQVMIGMILSFGSEDDDLKLYEGQWGAQAVITTIFFCSIPVFLVLRPCFEAYLHHGDPNWSVLEAIVMNLIHVIEFVLQALSHTASYLRLWALSLAHSQLSKVIWEELFLNGFNYSKTHDGPWTNGTWVLTFFVFLAFTVMTAAILLGMEAFSALLHGIRLMWVEFCSKFYGGGGYEFKPVSLKNTLKNAGYNDF